MRELTDHKTNAANDRLSVLAVDEPGSGGANHIYHVADTAENGDVIPILLGNISFQNGPIGEVGVNGLTHEVLLAIVIDRLRSFNAGPFASRENALALTKIEEGLMWLKERTYKRMARGVEGTHKV